MRIAVVALGKIGLPLAVQFAERGHQVVARASTFLHPHQDGAVRVPGGSSGFRVRPGGDGEGHR